MIISSSRPVLGKDDLFVITTLDGSATLLSTGQQVSYHSIYGAVSESRHVFIQHGLHTQLHRPVIHILEIGFGTGLNAFLSFISSVKSKKEIHYTGIDAFDLSDNIIQSLGYPEYLAASNYRAIFEKMHASNQFAEEGFHFHRHSSFEELHPHQKFDCVFFDAFGPADQPEMWEENIFNTLFAHMTAGACLVTYCAQGAVRRRMITAGFIVEKLPGAPGKRHMLRALKP